MFRGSVRVKTVQPKKRTPSRNISVTYTQKDVDKGTHTKMYTSGYPLCYF